MEKPLQTRRADAEGSGLPVLFFVALLCLFLAVSSIRTAQMISASAIQRPRTFAGLRVVKFFNADNSPIDRFPRTFRPNVVFQDKSGRYWIGGRSTTSSENAVLVYDETDGQWTTFGDKPEKDSYLLHYRGGAVIPMEVKRIGQSRDGRIWFSAIYQFKGHLIYGPVLTSFDGKRWQSQEIQFKSMLSPPRGFFVGKGGDIWFWNDDNLTKYDGQQWTHLKLTEAIKDPAPAIPDALKGTREAASIAARFRVRYNIHGGMQDSAGYVWLTTVSGIIRYDERRGEWKKLPRIRGYTVAVIYEDRQNRIWFANEYDAVVYDRRNNSTTEYPLSDHLPGDDLLYFLKAVHQDKEGRVLFVFDEGILVYSETEKKWEFHNIEDSGLGLMIRHLTQDRTGRIWMSTDSSLVVLDR